MIEWRYQSSRGVWHAVGDMLWCVSMHQRGVPVHLTCGQICHLDRDDWEMMRILPAGSRPPGMVCEACAAACGAGQKGGG